MTAWEMVRRYHVYLLVIGAIRLVGGQESAFRYIDTLGKGKT